MLPGRKENATPFSPAKSIWSIVQSTRTKGTGAQYLVKLLNIPHTSTVAIGDEQNDIPMIQSAHIGIAMKNGIDDIKKTADYVTENDNNHDAIAEVIEKFIL